ncbi:MAG: ParA family protein [Myxococcota bacterium]|nr:ParA family protein [Myxococcota bacterium]
MIIATSISKGGQGKSFLAMQIARALSEEYNLKVLAIDNDSQANLTSTFGINEGEVPDICNTKSLYHGYQVTPVEIENIQVVASDATLDTVDEGSFDQCFTFADTLTHLSKSADVTLIDCPPSAGYLGWAPLLCAEAVLIPVLPEDFGFQGLNKFLGHLEKAKSPRLNPNLDILGIVINLFDSRRALHKEYATRIREAHGDLVFDKTIGARTAYAEAIAARQGIERYAKKGTAVTEFSGFMDELVSKIIAKKKTTTPKEDAA